MGIFTNKSKDKTSATSVPVKKEASTKEPAVVAVPSTMAGKEAWRILVRPIVSEKAASLGERNQYVFEVQKKANKALVGRAIEEAYGVKPLRVNVVNVRGRSVRWGRSKGRRKAWKKAIVTLPEGKTIQIYEGV